MEKRLKISGRERENITIISGCSIISNHVKSTISESTQKDKPIESMKQQQTLSLYVRIAKERILTLSFSHGGLGSASKLPKMDSCRECSMHHDEPTNSSN